MNTSDKQAFHTLWAAAWANYGQKIDPSGVSFAFTVLSGAGYTLDQIKAGLAAYCLNPQHSYGPSASALVAQLTGDPEADALLAWPVVNAMIHGSSYNYVVFDDEVVHRVIQDMGGFEALGMTPNTEMKWKQMEFKERYATLKRAGNFTYPARLKLAGVPTAHLEYQVLYIGDKEECLMLEQKAEKENESLEWITESMKLISSDNELPF